MKTLHSVLDLTYQEAGLMELNLLIRGIVRSKQHVPKTASPMTPCILKKCILSEIKMLNLILLCGPLFFYVFF